MLDFPAQMALSPPPACAMPSSDPPLQEWILLPVCLTPPLDVFFALSSELTDFENKLTKGGMNVGGGKN